MTLEQKQQIVIAANDYCKEKELSNNELSRQTGINQGYLSNMLRLKFTLTTGGKEVEISERWFAQLATFIGVSINKTYWETIPTRQFTEIVSVLTIAKETQKTALLIAGTGLGKTESIDKFVNKIPLHTYRLTVSSLYKLVDIVNELGDKLNIEMSTINGLRMQQYSLKVRLDRIIDKLKEIKMNGGKPIIILDEGENMEMAVLKMIKALYDGLKDHCSIVLVGTPRLLDKMLNIKKRERQALPELYRRFKAGQKIISPIVKDKDFRPFFEKYNIETGLAGLLCYVCENYGELRDYLEPALKEADERGEPLTEKLFRRIYNMPK